MAKGSSARSAGSAERRGARQPSSGTGSSSTNRSARRGDPADLTAGARRNPLWDTWTTVRSSVDVHNYLLERDAPHEMVRARGRLRTPDRMAAALDLPLEQVGRVVIFEGDDGPLAA